MQFVKPLRYVDECHHNGSLDGYSINTKLLLLVYVWRQAKYAQCIDSDGGSEGSIVSTFLYLKSVN